MSLRGTALAVAATCLAACAGGVVDKQGAPVSAPTVLRIGAADPTDAELAFFVDAVDRRSAHRLRLEVDPKTYFSETPGGESKLAGDLRSGGVALGYIPSRDWAATGDPGFQAVQAPFLLTTTAAAVALARSPIADQLLAGLGSAGVHGLALIPGEARRLISRRPVLTAADLAGVRIRVSDSAQSARLLSALGATPVQGLLAAQTRSDLGAGRLEAVETAPMYVVPNSYNVSAPYLSSFGMFPKVDILAANGRAWDELGAVDQGVLQAAAADTLAYAAGDVPAREDKALSQLCGNGTVVVQPSDAALHALVVKAAAAQPQDARVRELTRTIAGAVTGSGPHPLAAALPAGCRVATTAAQALALHGPVKSSSATASSSAPTRTFPVGTYQVKVTAEQWAAAGQVGPDWESDTTFTYTLRADGTLRESQQPDYPDQGPGTGTWTVDADQVTFVTTYASDPSIVYTETLRWSYFKGELHFVVVDVQDIGGRVIYAQPWRKAG